MSLQSTEVKIRKVNELLRSWGYTVEEVAGAWGRNKGVQNGQGTPAQWTAGEPVGFVNHHFVIGLNQPIEGGVRNVTFGDSTLQGPKCNWYTHESRIVFVASGPANHAGSGNNDVLRRVTAGLPYSGTGPDNYNGNAFYFGQEAHHPGDLTPWPSKLVEHIVVLNAATCIVFGWNANHCIHHKWHTTRKVDMSNSFPGNIQDLVAKEITKRTNATVASLKPASTPTGDNMTRLVHFTSRDIWWVLDIGARTRWDVKQYGPVGSGNLYSFLHDTVQVPVMELNDTQGTVVAYCFQDITPEVKPS